MYHRTFALYSYGLTMSPTCSGGAVSRDRFGNCVVFVSDGVTKSKPKRWSVSEPGSCEKRCVNLVISCCNKVAVWQPISELDVGASLNAPQGACLKQSLLTVSLLHNSNETQVLKTGCRVMLYLSLVNLRPHCWFFIPQRNEHLGSNRKET